MLQVAGSRVYTVQQLLVCVVKWYTEAALKLLDAKPELKWYMLLCVTQQLIST